MSVNGKFALVTGGGSGIGEATCMLLARGGATVGVLDMDEEEVREVTRRIQEAGGDAKGLVADISDERALKQTVDDFGRMSGRIDICFANAGINGVWAPLDELAVEEFDKTIAVNLRGTFMTIKFCYPWMEKGGGSIIITSSVNGTRIFSNAGATAYSCTKAAQVALGKMLALELGKNRIRVNVVCPGAIETEIHESTELRDIEEAQVRMEFPEGRIPLTGDEPGSSEQVADLVHFLASDASAHISGAVIHIDGAQSLLQG